MLASLLVSCCLLTLGSTKAVPFGRTSTTYERRTTEPLDTYEYVVVGSGPGGGPLAARLAIAGHSVLLIDAGDDHGDAIAVQAPALFRFAVEDQQQRWDYYVHHYANSSRQQLDTKMVWQTTNGTKFVGTSGPTNSEPLGILYPRAGGLGGCGSHNAMITVYPFDSDWNYIANITNDTSWSASNMRQYFERLERNAYVPTSATGHGFMGWLGTRLPDFSLLFGDANIFSAVSSAACALGLIPGPVANSPEALVKELSPDLNIMSPDRDSSQGSMYGTVEAIHGVRRSSPRDLVLQVANALNPDGTRKYLLDISLNTLATKVRLETNAQTQPRAVGVDFLYGQSLYAADPRSDLSRNYGIPGTVNASREVIIAAGTFNTPQLLKLSGIGAMNELSQFDIDVVVDLPGVGTNMQDRYEVTMVTETPRKSTVYANCTFLTGKNDPCVDEFLDSGAGPYINAGPAVAIPRRSSEADNSDNDLYIAPLLGYFNGYFNGYSRATGPNPNMTYLSWIMLKAHSRNNAGTVTLRSSNPQEVPVITFNSFDAGVTIDNAFQKDIDALAEALEFGRTILTNQTRNGPFAFREVVPGPLVSTRAQLEDYIETNAWGHHASSSCPIGGDDDPMAVLDSKFRVRGVDGLRVVDASVFPKIPGFFIVVPIYMVSEKAADTILTDVV